jgi:hypothetical protein
MFRKTYSFYGSSNSKLQCHKTLIVTTKSVSPVTKKRQLSTKKTLLMRNQWEKKAIAEQDNVRKNYEST